MTPEDKLDKQYTYYTLKLLDNIFYISTPRTSIFDRVSVHRSIAEDIKGLPEYSKLPFDNNDFWEVYYRHNNYFLERNSSLLHKIKNNKNFAQAAILNNNTVGFEQVIEFFDPATHALSHLGVRVCSLMDIIKIQTSLGLGINFLNNCVKFLAERFKVGKEIIERVFRAGEDQMSMLLCHPPLDAKRASAPLEQANRRREVLSMACEYLTAKEGLELVLMCKEDHQFLKERWISYNLKFSGSWLEKQPSLRTDMWYAIIPAQIKQRKLRNWEEARNDDVRDANGEKLEELIELDLKRSVEFFDTQHYDRIKLFLLNVCIEYRSSIAYYQGMNYIAIFLFETFKYDDTKAFHFYCYMAERILKKHFSHNFVELIRLIWTSDRMMQIKSPRLWERLRNGNVSSIHFAVPNFITLFASLTKVKRCQKYILDIWDIMLSEGMYAILKTLIYILELQRGSIDQIDAEQLLIAMKTLESDPFAIIKQTCDDERIVEGYIDHLCKANLRNIPYDKKMYKRLESFYSEVVGEIHKFWQ
jgi:hypothetical protein